MPKKKKKKIHLINESYGAYCGRHLDGICATRHAVLVDCKLCIKKMKEEAERER